MDPEVDKASRVRIGSPSSNQMDIPLAWLDRGQHLMVYQSIFRNCALVALVGVRLLGFIGIVIAAPIMASMALLLNYVIKKLNDQDPWKDLTEARRPIKKAKWVLFIERLIKKTGEWIKKTWNRLFKGAGNTKEQIEDKPKDNPKHINDLEK